MSGDVELNEDPDLSVSDGASDNEYSENEHEIGSVRKEDETVEMAEELENHNGPNTAATATAKPKFDPKDPLRPRRKKARRACFACQRAHLTCGDERPCQRCIKRGLADACQDGVRKKAKYLHDAPPEALRPVLGPSYNQAIGNRTQGNGTSASDTSPGLGTFFPSVDTSPSYPIFAAPSQQNQMPPPLQARLSYGSQQSPISPPYRTSVSSQDVSMPGMNISTPANDAQNGFGGALFDPSNPALFNFDLEGLNFGNHYGALEFGMLGHMSSGAAETPPNEHNGSLSQRGVGDVNFNNNVFTSNISQFGNLYSPEMMQEFVGIDQQAFGAAHQGLPRAYAIATGPASHPSPSTDASPSAATHFDTPQTSSPTTNPTNSTQHSTPVNRPPKRINTGSKFGTASLLSKRTREPSTIYETVHEPYSYTAGFHALTAFLQRRFSVTKTLKIAKSLASIRPSFISSTRTLSRADLIFMEKCFQRTLFEYEEFMLNCCTPTLVCRRTGEVAAANKEFTLLTGWKKDVLLGKEPNLNVNTGNGSANTSGTASAGSSNRTGLTTPRMRSIALAPPPGQEGRQQSVFLAELLDDDSAVEFYEDFARLAFGDSRGSVTRKCKLLKYRTKTGISDEELADDNNPHKRQEPSVGIGGMGNRVRKIDGEHGIGRLEIDGKMDCSYCWTVKRDVFDIPMLIVMNFLPCI